MGKIFKNKEGSKKVASKEVGAVKQAVGPPTPEMLIQQAINQKVPIETMEKLMGMRRELRAEKAEEAFRRDLALFQGACPIIKKNKVVMNKGGKTERYRYAPLDDIVEQVSQFLSQYGFSYTIQTVNEPDTKTILSVLTAHHVEGHSRDTDFRVPIGSSEYMTEQQAYASASTFSKRYCFINGFGIMTGDADDDGSTVVSAPEATREDQKTPPPEPPTKSKEYLKLEKQILRTVGNKHFAGEIDLHGVPVDLKVVKSQAEEYLPKKIHSMKTIQDTAVKVAEMLEISLAMAKEPPKKDEVVIEKPEVVEEKKDAPPVKSTEYLEIEARIIKDILHPEFIGKVLFTDDDGKTHEPDLGQYKKKIPGVLARNFFTMEELEKKADMVARLLLAATTKHEKVEGSPFHEPVEGGQGSFDGFDENKKGEAEGNLQGE